MKFILGLFCLIAVSSSGQKKKEVKGRVGSVSPVTFEAPDANTITFDVALTDGPKFGQIGFLSSISLTQPVDEDVLPLKPYYWRTGGRFKNMPNSLDLYDRFKRLGVTKQLLMLSGFRNTSPTASIFKTYGAGALADTVAARVQRAGMDFEWDLYNEPNAMLKSNLDSFMHAYWIPAFKAIKARFPNAKIHGPSLATNNTENGGKTDSALVYRFFDAAIASNTMPNIVNWHFQIGYNIPEAQSSYVSQMKKYLASKGVSVDGFVCGETVRPGNERNTSPGILIPVFLTAELYKIPQIHAAWTSTPVYGIRTAEYPVIDGLFADTSGTGKRGVWWTYEFYGRMTGQRIKCLNSSTGISTLSGLAFRDDEKKEIKLMVGVRDNDSFKDQTDKSILIGNLNNLSGLVKGKKVHVNAWLNLQTKSVVEGYGTANLEKVIDADYVVDSSRGGSIFIDKPKINKYAALLIEIR